MATVLAFLVGGVVVFGFLFGALAPGGNNPNPVASLRALRDNCPQGALVLEIHEHAVTGPDAGVIAVLFQVLQQRATMAVDDALGHAGRA